MLEVLQSLSHSRVKCNHGRCTVCRRTWSTELEAITRKGKWRCAVTVGIIDNQIRNLWNIDLHALLTLNSKEIVLI